MCWLTTHRRLEVGQVSIMFFFRADSSFLMVKSSSCAEILNFGDLREREREFCYISSWLKTWLCWNSIRCSCIHNVHWNLINFCCLHSIHVALVLALDIAPRAKTPLNRELTSTQEEWMMNKKHIIQKQLCTLKSEERWNKSESSISLVVLHSFLLFDTFIWFRVFTALALFCTLSIDNLRARAHDRCKETFLRQVYRLLFRLGNFLLLLLLQIYLSCTSSDERRARWLKLNRK